MRIVKTIYKDVPGREFSARLLIPRGSAHDKNRPGIAHFVEHMAFKGTESISLEELDLLSERLGDFNAYTSFDRTVFHAHAMAQDAGEVLGLLLEMVGSAVFPEGEVEKEKTVICEEIQSWRANPNRWFWWQARHGWLGDTCRFQGGSEESVRNTSREDLIEWRDRANEAAILVVAGPSSALSTVANRVGDSQEVDPVSLSAEWNPGRVEFVHSSNQAIVALASPGLSYVKELDRNFATDVACSILGGGSHSLLWPIRQKLGLCYSVGASSVGEAFWGYGVVRAMVSPENAERVLDLIREGVRCLVRGDYSDEQLDVARRSVARGYAFMRGAARVASMGDFAWSRPGADWVARMEPERIAGEVLALSARGIQETILAIWGEEFRWAEAVMLPGDVSR